MSQHQKVTEEQIEKLAALSRMKLSDSEKQKYASEIDAILGYVDLLQEVTADRDMTKGKNSSLVSQKNVLREDKADPLETDREALIKLAPNSQDGYVKVKKILN